MTYVKGGTNIQQASDLRFREVIFSFETLLDQFAKTVFHVLHIPP